MAEDDASEFTPLNMVERQLIAAANGNTDQQKVFQTFILDETLYAATPEAHPEGFVTLQEDTRIKLLNVELNDGRPAAAIFTAPERIACVFGEVGYVGMPGRVLLEMIRTNPAVLNPGQSYGVVWEPPAIAAMLGLPPERIIKENTQILLGYPAEPPFDLIDRLSTAFSALSEIDAAWLALAAWPDTQDQSWYLDVRTTATEHDAIRRALPAAIEGADLKGHSIDMVIRQPVDAAGIGIPIVERRAAPTTRKRLFSRIFGLL